MALRPGSARGGSFIYPVGGGLGPPQGMMSMPQQQTPQQGFPMVPIMQPNMQGMMGMNFGAQLPTGPIPIQAGMALGMPAPGLQFMGQPQYIGLRAPGHQYPADLQKQMAEEHQKRLEQQQRMLEEDRKRRQFEEQKQKLRLLSSVKPKTGEKSRDDALEAIKGNLDGFSRDARMHPAPSSQPKQADSSPSHSSVPPHSLPPAFTEDDDEFSDFIQGPVDGPTHSLPLEAGPVWKPSPRLFPPSLPPTLPHSTAPAHSSVISSSQSAFQGPSLQEKLSSSCDLMAEKKAQVTFRPRPALCELKPRAQVTVQFPSSSRARDWANSDELSSAFTTETPPMAVLATEAPTHPESVGSGVGVFPQQDMQSVVPAWLYNDALIPELFKKVQECTMTPAGIDTAKLYPILMSSGLPREALGQIWASANRTTPGKLTKEELYTVLALIGAAQSGIPVMSLDILTQFPSPPVPTLPAMAVPLPPVLVTQPALLGTAGSAVLPLPPNPPPQPCSSFVTSFPPVQGAKAEDEDDFQDFQEAPKAGSGDGSFTDFQGEKDGAFPSASSQSSVLAVLTPVSGPSSSSDKYAVFKQLTAEQTTEAAPPASDFGDKYSVFRELAQPSDRKPIEPIGDTFGSSSESFADFKSVGTDDGFTDFKTASNVSPLDPPDQAKMFQPSLPAPFPPSSHSLPQPKNPLNMADLDLFASMAPSTSTSSIVDSKAGPFPSPAMPSLILPHTGPKPSGSGADDFGDFALFGSSASSSSEPASLGRRGGAPPQDDFADFLAFGGSGEARPEGQRVDASSGMPRPRQAPAVDKYDVFKQLSLEGGAGYAEGKEAGGGDSSSSLKGDADDFADFQSSKFCTALGSSEKSAVDKLAAFKQAKEDSASVKSLDLPSIGGSSVGKEDSEDALSVQLDMKLADMGGDLKHGMSDSSLDLPGLTAHQPPATETDDLKFDPVGSLVSGGLIHYDWAEKDSGLSGDGPKLPGTLPSSAVLHRKEMSFGSSENITHSTAAKVTTFPIEDVPGASPQHGFADFTGFTSSVEQAPTEEDEDDDDFGDFASTVSEKSDSPAGTADTAAAEFGAFQGDKPKFGKSDFLKASAQPKVKSSEEMIQNELATFDLSVQGSHKRSHSLGEKEIVRSTPSPAPEQLFRDRSNTLSEKTVLPVIRDKYKDLTGEVEESERYAYEWQRCLESALQVITTANNTLNGISSSSVCTEVIQSAQGMEYLQGVVEVYRVARRVELGIKATAVCSETLQHLLKDIGRVWNNLLGFMSLADLSPDESSLDFSSCILRHGIKNAKELACGVCLLNVDSRSKAFNSETDNFKLTYGGHQYHASCANFWINCVEPKPPGLILPDLL
ncbi:synergin gamma isoform X1 [Electrophorus electricus]|uniref:synergin gamma isoform X1 n=1 Tax=Electrophorus electricus TaxID=8005 RepID=UPI0015CFCB53|nr:synergin gamma isoform X1 [Electrophorus electricus]